MVRSVQANQVFLGALRAMPNATTPVQDHTSSDEDHHSQRNFAFRFDQHPVLAHVKGTGADLVMSMSVLPRKKNVAVYRMAGI
jgi:hypothetical protein